MGAKLFSYSIHQKQTMYAPRLYAVRLVLYSYAICHLHMDWQGQRCCSKVKTRDRRQAEGNHREDPKSREREQNHDSEETLLTLQKSSNPSKSEAHSYSVSEWGSVSIVSLTWRWGWRHWCGEPRPGPRTGPAVRWTRLEIPSPLEFFSLSPKSAPKHCTAQRISDHRRFPSH